MALPLTRAEHATPAVTGFFEALLPEQGPARERLELESGVSRSNVFGLLAYVGRDLPGAVCIVREGEGLPTDGGVVTLTDSELAERLADLRRSAASGGLPLSEHGQWSLAGAQAKLALTYADGQWGVPFGSAPTTHIVKPAIPGYEHFDAFEVTCLRAARRLGLSTAEAWLQPLVDGTNAAVVVRYDRVSSSDGSMARVHQEDFCQALAYPAWQKYERDGGPGLKQIGSLIRRLPVHLREDSAMRLFDALAFNYAIAGTDGHARNFSLLLSGPDADTSASGTRMRIDLTRSTAASPPIPRCSPTTPQSSALTREKASVEPRTNDECSLRTESKRLPHGRVYGRALLRSYSGASAASGPDNRSEKLRAWPSVPAIA